MENRFDPFAARTSGVYKLTVALLFLFGFWMYYPALSLPHSLIDDFVFIRNTERWIREVQEAGWKQALRHDVGVKQGVFNIAFMLAGVVNYRLSGGQPHHYVRLLILLWTCVGFVMLSRRLLPRTSKSAYVALAGVVLFLIGDVPGSVNMQSLRANYYRLFCSDAEGIAFLLVEALAIFQIYENLIRGRRTWVMILLAIFGGFMAFAYKMPFFGIAFGPAVIVALAAYMSGDRKLGHRYSAIAVGIGALFALINAALRMTAVERDAVPFAASFSFAPAHIVSGMRVYGAMYRDLLGPLLPVFIVGTGVLGVHHWRGRYGPDKLSFLGFSYFVTFAICAFVIYLPWNYRLPRYMLSGYFGVCMVLTLLLGFGLRYLVGLWREKPWALALIPAGLILPFLPPVVFVPLLIVSIVAILAVRKPYLMVPLLAGLMLVGAGYRLAATQATRKSLNMYYADGEHVNWRVTMDVLALSAKGYDICFAGDVNEETFGAMRGFITRMGIQSRFYSFGSPECTSGALVMVHNYISPADVKEKALTLPLARRYSLSDRNYVIPVSFWTFRKRLFDPANDLPLTYHLRYEEYRWQLHNPAGPVFPLS